MNYSEENKKANQITNEYGLWIPLISFTILSFLMMIGAANLAEGGENLILSSAIITASFILSSWVCLVAIEKSKFTEWIWSFKSSSVIAGVFISVFVFFSSLKASTLINEIFLSDASAFVYTKVIGTFLYAFRLFMPLFFSYLVIAFLVMFKQMIKPSDGEGVSGLKIVVFAINGIILGLLGGIPSYSLWDNVFYKSKIESISEFADFGKHSCTNINHDLKVVYLGPTQREVLVKYVDDNKENNYIHSECLPDTANKAIKRN